MIIRTLWQRDLFVGLLAALLTAGVLVPLGWSAVSRQRRQTAAAEQQALEATRRAEQRVAELNQLAARNLVEQAGKLALDLDPKSKDVAVMRITTAAVTPELPEGSYLLIDKKASTFRVGDIVVFKNEGKNFLARVLAIDNKTGRLTLGRNGEANRTVPPREILGRGVLNSR
jgi:hypothetical protein